MVETEQSSVPELHNETINRQTGAKRLPSVNYSYEVRIPIR